MTQGLRSSGTFRPFTLNAGVDSKGSDASAESMRSSTGSAFCQWLGQVSYLPWACLEAALDTGARIVKRILCAGASALRGRPDSEAESSSPSLPVRLMRKCLAGASYAVGAALGVSSGLLRVSVLIF